MERLKSVPRLWRRRSNNQQTSPDSPPTHPHPSIQLEDDDPLELATQENIKLQITVSELNQSIKTILASHLALQSKADDLELKLQLERRRIDWQKCFYEKKIVEVAMGMGGGPSSVDTEALLSSISLDFYQQTIQELVAEHERKDGEIENIKNSFKKEIQTLQKTLEEQLAESVQQHFRQVQELTLGQEELIRDLLSGCEEGLFKEMKQEFLVDAEMNVELQSNNGNKIWIQFQNFSTQKKGIIIAVICIVTVATAGWAGWGFITWVWPRLVIFAESVLANPQTLSTWTTYIVQLLKSPQFLAFVSAWEQGQPLGSCLKPFMNTALLASALNLAPNLFAQLKKRNNNQVTQVNF